MNSETPMLKDRIYLVTGAANGFGRAITMKLATEGATVIMLDKDQRRLESLYDEIVKAGFPEPVIHPMDFTKVELDHYLQLGQALENNFPQLDGIIHNAALFTGFTPLANFKPDVWFNILQTNLNAPHLINQVCLPLIQKSDNAHVIFIDETLDARESAYWGAYGVSKAALLQLMYTLSSETASEESLSVWSYNPGPLKTALRGKMYPAENPDGLGEPEVAADHLVHCLIDDSVEKHGKVVHFSKD
jgi:NAD(P)-dependent dehydrogenase (short-subunit alcohol dehydrogenase family)